MALVAEVDGSVVGHVILTIIHIGEGAEAVKSLTYGLTFKFEVPDDVAMVIELWPGALNGVSGCVRLSEAFGPLYT